MHFPFLSPLPSPRRSGLLLAVQAALALPAAAQEAAPTRIVVTGSVVQRMIEEAPYAISLVDADTLRSSGPMINLSEALTRVPGVLVANRNNYAQDLQISSRGFGARAGFGVRGLRLYTDGIPATMPDGQGQVSHFDLAGAQRIEVLRGPFSVLYGNSSGGVIAAFSAPVRERRYELAADAGSFGLRQLRGSLALPLDGGFDLRVGASALEIENFRPHAAAQRQLGNLRLGWRGARDEVTVIANALDQPADDPLGLTREQFDQDPRQTTPQATLFDTRKTARQGQLGASWRHRFDDGALRRSELALYRGERSVTQWLAIPVATQAGPRHGGGVIDFDRDYEGVEARLVWQFGALDAVTGVAYERQRDERRGYENFVGSGAGQVLGVTGTLRREELNGANTRDAFVQLEWPLLPQLVLSGGVRSGQLRLSADDRYLANGDDSGRLRFSYTNPVAGLRWTPSPGLNLHASVARGFEAPTLNELAYRSDGASGFNEGLQPQVSKQAELGVKWQRGSVELAAALFHIDVDNEIGVATNAGGRSSFQNVGRTRRSGAELSLAWEPVPAWRGALAVSTLNARYRDSFVTCTGVPCTAASPANKAEVPAGNRVAGTQRGTAFGEITWRPASDREFGLEWRAVAATAVNDINSDQAAGYGLFNLRALKRYALGEGRTLELLLRVDNLADRVHAGSVIVNEGNGRFFEPGTPRSVLFGLRLIGAL